MRSMGVTYGIDLIISNYIYIYKLNERNFNSIFKVDFAVH